MSMDTFFASLSSRKLPSLEETMKYAGLRLASFHKRPLSYTTSAVRQAHAGFFYTGQDDMVECFKCHLQVSNWAALGEPVDPFAVHMQRSSDCPFIVDNDKENVAFSVNPVAPLKPLTPPPNSPATPMQSLSMTSQPLQQQSGAKNPMQPIRFQPFSHSNNQLETDSMHEGEIKSDSPPDGTSSQGGAFVRSSAGLPSNTSSRYGRHEMSISTAPITHNIQMPLFSSFGTPQSFNRAPLLDRAPRYLPNYRDEQQRLDTFTYWPNTSAVRPAELARAGFYYLGTEDRVQCAFCKGVLRNWDPVDHAFEEHKKHFPQCPYVRDVNTSGNIPIKDQLSGVNLRRELKNKQEQEEYILGVMTERAYHTGYAMKIERLNTFDNFYSDSCRTKEEFAEAGFFYTGQGDNVKCFFCDGGLRNWERNDDPWLEHARWFPKCGYLRTKKGEEYVKEIRKKYAPPGTKKPRLRKLKLRHVVTDADLKRHMSIPMIRDAFEMGFPVEEIEKVVKRRLGELGSMFPNVESLIDALYEAEEIAQQLPETDDDDDDEDEETIDVTAGSDKQVDDVISESTNGAAAVMSQNLEKKKNKKRRKNKKKQDSAAANNAGAPKAPYLNPFDLMDDTKVSGPELVAEVQKMKDERMCKVCMDNEVNIVFLKCGHLVCCSDCAPALRHCPICRENIRGTIRVFLS